jgi:glutathione S-transferase
MSHPKVSAYRWAPPFAQGLVRDLRVRWALEEAGIAYDVRLLSLQEPRSEEYLRLQPFGQVPAYEEDGLAMFESGAIVLHIAERSLALMPAEPAARTETLSWMFAALNSVEPPITMLNVLDRQPADVLGRAPEIRAAVVERTQGRLDRLAAFLGDREHLVAGRFTAADLLMTTVLRALRNTDLIRKMPSLEAYLLQCEARPAFKKALEAQLAVFAAHAPKGA